jgi:hypothetical protein
MRGEGRTPRVWSALNDVEESDDGVMYYAVVAYGTGEDKYDGFSHVTTYDLTIEEAWALVHSHNERHGFND